MLCLPPPNPPLLFTIPSKTLKSPSPNQKPNMLWYHKGLKGYWKRRTKSNNKVRKNKIVLGGAKKRRIWRIRVSPKLLFLRAFNPKRIIARIRDAYVRMMQSFAQSGAVGGYGCDVFVGFKAAPAKEYDERMIIEIYKSLLSQGRLIASSGVGGVVPSGQFVERR